MVVFCVACKLIGTFANFDAMELVVHDILRKAIWSLFEANRQLVLQKVAVKRGPEQEEAIHQLRVATKKIRSVYRLCEVISAGKFRAKKEISELRTLFRAAGVLRELQVHVAVVEDYETLQTAAYPKLSKLLRIEQRVAKPYFEEARHAFRKSSLEDSGKKIARILKHSSEESVHSALVQVTLSRLRAMHQAMPAGYDPEEIHKARISLKEAMYLIGLLHDAGYKSDFEEGLLIQAKLAAELAGDWHDREVFYQWLQIQIRPHGIQLAADQGYSLLIQDLHVHTRTLVKRFREAIEPLQLAVQSFEQAGQ